MKDKKRRMDTDFEAQKHSALLTVTLTKLNGIRRKAREKQEQIMSLEDKIENKLKQLKG